MNIYLFFCAIVILTCVLFGRFSSKIGVPALLLFMVIGMMFGSDGILSINFDDYQLTEQVCSTALIFIMFYGGFCVKWEAARPVIGKAVAMSTLGVIMTAGITCILCHLLLQIGWAESFLIGAVISSTDAASVFSILRSKNLSLKYATAPLLEIESGSNDPVAYMLTMIGLALVSSEKGTSVPYLIFAQIVFGILFGIGVAAAAIWLMHKISIEAENLDMIFMIGVALAAYAIPSLVGGNGYLSVYLAGIILGNSKLKNKTTLVHFFDGITGLAQICLFFLLGFLAFPHKLPQVAFSAVIIALILNFVARPLATFAILLPARASIRQCLLISFAGLRGAASIVFAIMVIARGAVLEHDLFHTVFLVSLFSVALQGSLLPAVARRLDMVDKDNDVRKTFNDYQEETAITLMQMNIQKGHNWENRMIKEVSLPSDSLAVMIKREGETLIPKGDTRILAGDSLILNVPYYSADNEVKLQEILIDKNHAWCNKKIMDLDLAEGTLVTMIRRDAETIIPDGQTTIRNKDIVVICKQES
ncbi:MAG: potassium/proton antiporter [Lachnospiraceae bacterium]|nr:potassium/proton antiporter [Lachnospiraceae bacterium]